VGRERRGVEVGGGEMGEEERGFETGSDGREGLAG
jgi:hypothetical protein